MVPAQFKLIEHFIVKRLKSVFSSSGLFLKLPLHSSKQNIARIADGTEAVSNSGIDLILSWYLPV